MNEFWTYIGESWYYWTLNKLFRETSFVAESDGEIIGFIVAMRNQGNLNEVYVEDILIDRQHRRNKIGTMLFNALFEKAKALSCDAIWGTIHPYNKVSLSFTKSLGFRNATKEDFEKLCKKKHGDRGDQWRGNDLEPER